MWDFVFDLAPAIGLLATVFLLSRCGRLIRNLEHRRFHRKLLAADLEDGQRAQIRESPVWRDADGCVEIPCGDAVVLETKAAHGPPTVQTPQPTLPAKKEASPKQPVLA